MDAIANKGNKQTYLNSLHVFACLHWMPPPFFFFIQEQDIHDMNQINCIKLSIIIHQNEHGMKVQCFETFITGI